MDKWEYKIQVIYGNSVTRMNELGSRGWELVTIVPTKDAGKYFATFKRKNNENRSNTGPVPANS